MSNQVSKKVFLINGPPNSGKDTLAIQCRNFLMNKLMSNPTGLALPEIIKFADPIKWATHALYNVPYSCEHYEREHGNSWKDQPQPEFYGRTPRSEYIAMSEDYAKHRHGDDIFGHIMARRIHLSKNNVFLISDSGFYQEALPVIKQVDVSNVVVIELDRPDCSFYNDSRGYIGNELKQQFPSIEVIRLSNNDDTGYLRILSHGIMMKYLGIKH
ncbi:MAG: hypothetical protein IM561_09005 [Microcystis sp. M60BS1]|uniref:hypothetical protein n=1 Tax=unclassified Microcystis TaxID=2643300 RepID=UPI00257F5173|nr:MULTISPECIES: hypothetical protein [unclassified Microcystis]MCA2594370.1 hypothetical protein [Microcystis sp. M38BS1]MCA6581506.1 hypothetical protein [Pseudanabaena sp. M34BS1SP1A06MG]MCA2510507.1 hypothetical protein [Microcystis sp. M60BS1]MCA2555741.1 hypothetical protein [Microcystis sp. M43BS1]MCA2593017.1 hypothetical protein [Microcystis sp. M31BS1]